MSLRAVLFDAAGTLIHVREPVGVTYARIAHAHGVEASAEAIEPAFRAAIRAMPVMVFPGLAPTDCVARERDWWRELVQRVFAVGAPQTQFDNFAAYFDAVFDHYAQPAAWVVPPEARATLEALRARRFMTGIVSNFDHRLPALLDGLRLTPLLDVVIRPADAGAAKPDPRIFALALQRLGVDPGEALYVGDDEEEDIGGGTAAGLRAVNVTTLPGFGALLDYVMRS